jgi:hypothetical protein
VSLLAFLLRAKFFSLKLASLATFMYFCLFPCLLLLSLVAFYLRRVSFLAYLFGLVCCDEMNQEGNVMSKHMKQTDPGLRIRGIVCIVQWRIV